MGSVTSNGTSSATSLSFEQWLGKVDKIISRILNDEVSEDSGVDWPSMDCYDSEMTPAEGAQEWALYQDMPEELLEEFLDGVACDLLDGEELK
jgi:hypothetical protein